MSMREMKLILKPGGRAYVSVARGPWSHVNGAEFFREARLTGGEGAETMTSVAHEKEHG